MSKSENIELAIKALNKGMGLLLNCIEEDDGDLEDIQIELSSNMIPELEKLHKIYEEMGQ